MKILIRESSVWLGFGTCFCKANQRTQKSYLLLSKSSFCSVTKLKASFPYFQLLLGKKYPLATSYIDIGSSFSSARPSSSHRCRHEAGHRPSGTTCDLAGLELCRPVTPLLLLLGHGTREASAVAPSTASKLSYSSPETQPRFLLGWGFTNGTFLTAAMNWASSASTLDQDSTGLRGVRRAGEA